MSETFSPVESCAVTFQDWTDRARVKCSSKNPYHCVEDEFSRTVEVCVESIWIEPGHCPVYNTKAKKMDSQKCLGPNCPGEVYKSNDVSKYNSCQRSSTSTRLTTTQPIRNSTSQTTSSDTTIIAVSVSNVLFVILLTILGVILWRKYKCKTLNVCCPGREDHLEGGNKRDCSAREPLMKPKHENQSENLNKDVVQDENIPVVLHVDTDYVSKCLQSLREHKTLALYGKWGSGKRTLAKQIALKLAQEEGLKIRIVRQMLQIPDNLASTRSTVLILYEPIKSHYTDRHNHDIFNCLLGLRTNAEKNNSFQLAVFHCDDINITAKLFSQIRENIYDFFPQIYNVSISSEKLREIADRRKENISSDMLKKLSENDTTSTVGCTLKLTLFLRNKNNELLAKSNTDPVEFVMGTLRLIAESQSISHRVIFKSLLRMTFLSTDVEKTLLRNIIEYAMLGEIKVDGYIHKEDIIRECIQQLLQYYIEETEDGKSYRVIHDVITRCTLYTAMQYLDYKEVFNECDHHLLFDCIRHKTKMERATFSGKFTFDKTLQIGVPPDSFPSLAQSCRLRMMTMIRNLRIFENQKLQTEWINAQERLKNK